MRKIILVLCFFSQTVLSLSEKVISDYEGGYSTLCIEENSVGFNWRDNKWIKTGFIGSKYLVKKISHSELKEWQKKELYDENYLYLDRKDDEFRIMKNYYNIRRFGDKFIPLFNQTCSELWDGKELESIQCPNFIFKPDGYFHRSSIHGSLDEKDDYKDSLSLSYGKCSKI